VRIACRLKGNGQEFLAKFTKLAGLVLLIQAF